MATLQKLKTAEMKNFRRFDTRRLNRILNKKEGFEFQSPFFYNLKLAIKSNKW